VRNQKIAREGRRIMPHIWEKSYPPGVRWDAPLPARPLYDVVEEAFRKFANQPLCDFMDRKYSYREIETLVDRAARGFQGLGVGPGKTVGLYLPNCPHHIIAYMAIVKLGGIVVNFSPLDAERELAHKIEDSETEIVVTLSLKVLYPNMAKLLGRTRLKTIVIGGVEDALPFPKNLLFPLAKRGDIAEIPKDGRHVRWKDLINNAGGVSKHKVNDPKEEVAVLQYTGGTTGVPKAAMLTHANLTAAIEQQNLWTKGEPPVLEEGKERILAVLPLFHVYAMTVIMLRGITSGCEIILHPRFDLMQVIRDIDRKKPTVFPGVPTMYMAIASHPEIGKYNLSSLKFCGSGGAPLPVEVQEKFERLTGCKLVEGWGMSETSPTGTTNPLAGKRKVGSTGLPLPGIVIEVVDVGDPMKLLGPGERGEICIRGPNVMKGYWKKPKETEEAFLGGRFHTGDVGYIDEDGFVFLVDRKKDMIISGGYNVYPRNIEEAMYQHPAVEEVTVIGIPDDYRGQSAKAFVKLKSGAAAFGMEEMRAFLADKLGKHEMPAEIEIRDALPKTPVGKLSKKELVAEEIAKYEALRKKAG